MNIVALCHGVKSCLSHADMGFTPVEYDVVSIHLRDQRFDARLEHGELLLVTEDMHSTVMLLSDDLRDGPEVDLSSGNNRDAQDLRDCGKSARVMSHCVESEYMLC